MQESVENSAQGADPSSKLPSTFSLNHQDPNDKPKHRETTSTRYTSIYQPSPDDSMETSLIIQANATLSIDNQLSSGWLSCYKYWLFFLAFPNIIYLCYNSLHPSIADSLIIQSIQCFVEVAYAITMVFALKSRKLDTALLAFWLAIADFVFWIHQFYIFVLGMRDFLKNLEGSFHISGAFIAFSICVLLWYLFYYILGIVIPAWKIRRLIEKREAILHTDLDPYNV